jgi:hypothetical protein
LPECGNDRYSAREKLIPAGGQSTLTSKNSIQRSGKPLPDEVRSIPSWYIAILLSHLKGNQIGMRNGSSNL